MRLADLATPAGRIHKSLEELQLAWASTQEEWNDVNSRKFEEEQLLPLAFTVKQALDAVGRMSEALFEAERACTDGEPLD